VYIDKSDLVYKNQTTTRPPIAQSYSDRMHAEDISTIGKTSYFLSRFIVKDSVKFVLRDILNLATVSLIFAHFLILKAS
jgi:hypothetical protein